MLRELSVRNLALIEDARVQLEPGYCAWTGETGAGKSLLLTAIGLVLGGKAHAGLVRTGRPEAVASAVFELDDTPLRDRAADALGAEIEGPDLILTRRVAANGRSTAHANGMPVAPATLRALGSLLIDVHGQDQGRDLLAPDRQREALDAHAVASKPLAAYRAARLEFARLTRLRDDLRSAIDRREREHALLCFERDELAALDPRRGEPAGLAREAQRLASQVDVRAAAAEAYSLLYEADRSAQAVLGKVARRLGGLGAVVPDFARAANDLLRLAEETRDVAQAVRDAGDGPDDDPGRPDEIEARLAEYRRLAARFKVNPDELAARRESIDVALRDFDRAEADLSALDRPWLDAWRAVLVASKTLTGARKRGAIGFAKAVASRLKTLGLSGARLTVEVETAPASDAPPDAAPPIDGLDRVCFLFSANPGEPPRPLRDVASGGELSRVTLAVKAALAGVHGTPTLVFDEVDTGVGGRLGAALGRTLADLARGRQVVCVTHLPQLASHASHHWVVRKADSRGRSRTTIERLTGPAREAELAAMLRGPSATATTREEARAMLIEAHSPG